MRFIIAFTLSLALLLPSFVYTAHAQYFGGGGEPLTKEQQDFCAQHDVNPYTQNNILAKERVMAAQQASSQQESAIILSGVSNGGKYIANIYWVPNDVKQINSFDIYIYDSTHRDSPIIAKYDVMLYKDGEYIAPSHRTDQTSQNQKYAFDTSGSYTIRIDNINDSGQRVEIPIQVTPEFPLGTLVIFGAVSTAVIVALRLKPILN